MSDVFWGLFIPFLGTSLGAACVFFMRGEMNRSVQRDGFCGRRDGGGIGLESSDPCDRRV